MNFPRSRFVADFVGTTNLFEGTVSSCEPGLIRVQCAETGGELMVDDSGTFTVDSACGWRCAPKRCAWASSPWTPPASISCVATVRELGYLGTARRIGSGPRAASWLRSSPRTSAALRKPPSTWSDEVFVSWSADAAVLLQS